jgi:hypothetical protein
LRLEALLSSPSVLRLAPASPTLFGGDMAGGMGGMGLPSGPVRMGDGMRAPVLEVGDGDGVGGMGGMGGMR